MLKPVRNRGAGRSKGTFAIVASRYNALYVDAMLRAAQAELKAAGANVRVVRVPGAFEIPVVAARLAEKHSPHTSHLTPHTSEWSAIICLGVIFQGQTSHAQHIGWGVTHALAQVQLQHKIPVIHGVFVFEQEEHARVRCLGKKHNRGTEAARTALEMAKVMAQIG
jgi:6,7-dimethyl-8-ribityllumazine synthase